MVHWKNLELHRSGDEKQFDYYYGHLPIIILNGDGANSESESSFIQFSQNHCWFLVMVLLMLCLYLFSFTVNGICSHAKENLIGEYNMGINKNPCVEVHEFV